jgi:hypothetical protein
LVYVDDIVITSNNPKATTNLISRLQTQFSLKNLGRVHHILGIEVTLDPCGDIYLSQTKYINDFLAKHNMSSAKPIKTPMAPGLKLIADITDVA